MSGSLLSLRPAPSRASAGSVCCSPAAGAALLPLSLLHLSLPYLPSSRRRLLHALQAPAAAESLIADALLASSTDHEGESIANCLEPTRRSRNLLCYWSSAGSPVSPRQLAGLGDSPLLSRWSPWPRPRLAAL